MSQIGLTLVSAIICILVPFAMFLSSVNGVKRKAYACPQCDKDVPLTSSYCPNCGAPMPDQDLAA